MIVACIKWVAHPGEPHDERFAGMSPADQAALELALRQAAEMATTVTAVTAGPAAADKVLRDALAAGATRAVRVDVPIDAASDDVAAALATAIDGDGRWVWCGDMSLDRGTGSVPAYLAALLGARQALGIIEVTPAGHDTLRVTRRLDGGRRELLEVMSPAVVSVEGAVAHLRRASLPSLRAASAGTIEVRSPAAPVTVVSTVVQPFRPRARTFAAPSGDRALDRLRVLTDAAAASAARGELVELTPADAASRIMRALRDWGYIDA